MNTPGFDKVDFSRLHLTLGGGMAVQRAVADRWKKVTGCTLAEAYGLTETSPAVCINPLDIAGLQRLDRPCRSRRPKSAIQDEDGKTLPIGEVGELCVRGPQVMKGYWQRPDETAKVLAPDGWLRTGDIARMDEKGYVYIVDRKKDMILVSGFNVYPNEIEDVVAQCAGVLEVAAVGVPDEKSGEAVKIVIVRKDPALTVEDDPRALPREPDRLQAAQIHRVPRFAAEDECRQDPAARIARAGQAGSRPQLTRIAVRAIFDPAVGSIFRTRAENTRAGRHNRRAGSRAVFPCPAGFACRRSRYCRPSRARRSPRDEY